MKNLIPHIVLLIFRDAVWLFVCFPLFHQISFDKISGRW